MKLRNLLAISGIGMCLLACNTMKVSDPAQRVNFTETASHPIIKTEPGIKSYDETLISYKTSNGKVYDIYFSKPSVVAMADKEYIWGYYQFPTIGYKKDGSVAVSWEMKKDIPEEYGKESKFSYVSKDKGKTWSYIQNDTEGFGGTKTVSGDHIKMRLPENIRLTALNLPPVTAQMQLAYNSKPIDLYKIHDLPASRQGVFMERQKKGQKVWVKEQDKLIDPTGYRYSYNGFMPVVWLGDMRLDKSSNTLYACVYRDLRHGAGDTQEGYIKEGMGCFSSKDNGYTWQFQGASFYTGGDKSVDSIAEKRAGWLEPGMEILKDGSFLCVLRSDDGQGKAPMYIVRSFDKGKTWTEAKAITRYGVLPRLLLLDNGVLVMSSGRPGVSLRFSTDNGETWTEAFEQLPVPYTDEWHYTCGYTNMIPTGKNKFLMVYSDFKMKNEKGEERKGIKVREVTINKK